ncbi:hypothetical protein HKX48_007270, partial [Thoreauomyces humboldtii]
MLAGTAASPPAPVERLMCTVQPARSVGPFVLGSRLGAVMDLLRDRADGVSRVQCIYDDLHASSTTSAAPDIVLVLSHNGLCLRFDPVSQLLKVVEMFDFTKLWLDYKGTTFNSHKILPTFVSIYKLLGPTYPGEFCVETREYTLTYPGASFVFPIPDEYIPLQNMADLPLSFPDGTTPVPTRAYIFAGAERWQDAVAPRPRDDVGTVSAKIGKGIRIPGHPRGPVVVSFGDPTQDVLDAIGKPEGVCPKEEDAMPIFGGGATAPPSGGAAGVTVAPGTGSLDTEGDEDDYFWNCTLWLGRSPTEAAADVACSSDFSLGLDILFSGTTHTVSKLILHTNNMGSWDVGVYAKCQFALVHADSDTQGNSQGTAAASTITPESNWQTIQASFLTDTESSSAPRPVVHNRGGHQNPFGPTCFYGFPGVVFEVASKTGALASVTLYEDASGSGSEPSARCRFSTFGKSFGKTSLPSTFGKSFGKTSLPSTFGKSFSKSFGKAALPSTLGKTFPSTFGKTSSPPSARRSQIVVYSTARLLD